MNLMPLPEILEGPDSLRIFATQKLPEIRYQRALVLAAPHLMENGEMEKLQQLFPASLKLTIFSKFDGDPSIEEAQAAVDLAQSLAFDFVIAIGGGSVIDTAKLAALLSKAPLDIGIRDLIGNERAHTLAGIPLIAIPTTAGTGSEVTPIAIFSDHIEQMKKSIVSKALIPTLAVLDPTLTLSLPKHQTAYTGVDALVHAMESYLSLKANDFTENLSLRAVELIARNLLKAFRDGMQLEARSALLRGSLFAGIAFSNAGVAAVHALAYPLGGQFDLAHGLSNGLMLPEVMAFNESAAPKRIARLAETLAEGLNKPRTGIKGILNDLLDELSFPKSLEAAGVPASALETMAKKAMEIQRLLINNPRPLTETDALNLYRAAHLGRH